MTGLLVSVLLLGAVFGWLAARLYSEWQGRA